MSTSKEREIARRLLSVIGNTGPQVTQNGNQIEIRDGSNVTRLQSRNTVQESSQITRFR